MMLYHGGISVNRGTYWNVSTGERVAMEERKLLPGDERTRYIKASGLTVLLLGPVAGLVFAMFLPFIGIAMSVAMGAKKIKSLFVSAAAKTAPFAWRPMETYLAGRRRMKEREKHKPKEEQK